jgi:hypothetical protein
MNISKLKKTYSRVLGVDCSSNSFAFSLYIDGKLDTYGEIEFGTGTLLERIGEANHRINAAYELLDTFHVDKIVIEAATFINNRKTVIDLAYSFGAALSPIIRRGVTVETVPPITWQSFIGNKSFTKVEKDSLAKQYPDKSVSWLKNQTRELRKQRTIDWVKSEHGVIVESDDVADAIGIGFWGVHG